MTLMILWIVSTSSCKAAFQAQNRYRMEWRGDARPKKLHVLQTPHLNDARRTKIKQNTPRLPHTYPCEKFVLIKWKCTRKLQFIMKKLGNVQNTHIMLLMKKNLEILVTHMSGLNDAGGQQEHIEEDVGMVQMTRSPSNSAVTLCGTNPVNLFVSN